MIESIEKALAEEVRALKMRNVTVPNENVNVADLVFSYNNNKLINAMRERGNNIAL